MAGLAHIIGGVTFGALTNTPGRYSLGCLPCSDEYELLRFHPAATDGNYVIRNGRVSAGIVARMKYIGASATILAQFQADVDAWQNTAVQITDSAGTTHANCNLKPKSMRVTDGPHGIGGTSTAYFDAECEFTMD